MYIRAPQSNPTASALAIQDTRRRWQMTSPPPPVLANLIQGRHPRHIKTESASATKPRFAVLTCHGADETRLTSSFIIDRPATSVSRRDTLRKQCGPPLCQGTVWDRVRDAVVDRLCGESQRTFSCTWVTAWQGRGRPCPSRLGMLCACL